MKISISSKGLNLESPLEERFGRAPSFIIYDMDNDSYHAVDNSQNYNSAQGVMRVGEAMSPPLIKKVKQHSTKRDTVVIDCPPGTSCPMIQAVKGNDFVLMVTEPTPFGLSDLKLAVETVRELKIPFAICINRSTIGDEKVENYCKEENIPIILKIPEDRQIAEAYSQGKLFLGVLPHYEKLFDELFKSLEEMVLC